MFKDIVFLLKNGSIEKIENSIPLLSNFKMLTKDYIKTHGEIIWRLFIEYGYYNVISKNPGNQTFTIIYY